ncbi:UTRA domain-containing protein [Paraburkholderia youngii]|uniref:UTRA domain-containing protein n=1 Tax=Paraburkholderia youngii TaxID=2782701 RepID=A0A7Y6MZB6_9BURK|nr:UTRA domain-containing protein [Paraburkholderia youngii]NUY00320.1 UTRA domain-containing protein [Paraburkholderia youngii]
MSRSLEIDVGAPLLLTRRATRLDDDRVCEATVFRIRPERHEFVVTSGVEGKLAS